MYLVHSDEKIRPRTAASGAVGAAQKVAAATPKGEFPTDPKAMLFGEPARWGPHARPAALVPMTYPEQVAAAGGVPVLLPPVPGIQEAMTRLDVIPFRMPEIAGR